MSLSRRQLIVITTGASLSAVALDLFWAFRFEGLYRLVAEFQLERWNEYEANLTLGLSLLPLLVPLALLQRAYRRAPGAPFDARAILAQLARHGVAVLSLGLFLVGLLLGAYFLIQAEGAGPLTRVDASQLCTGQAPMSRYIELSNFALLEPMRVVESARETLYFPTVPSDNLASVDDVRLVVSQPAFDPHHAKVLLGLLSRGVPPIVRWRLEHEGRHVRSDVWLLEATRSPSELRLYAVVSAVLMTVVALTIALVLTIAIRVQRRRAAR